MRFSNRLSERRHLSGLNTRLTYDLTKAIDALECSSM